MKREKKQHSFLNLKKKGQKHRSKSRKDIYPKKSQIAPEQRRRPVKDFADVLDSTDKRLSSFYMSMSLIEILNREFQSLREPLEFSQQQVEMSLKTPCYRLGQVSKWESHPAQLRKLKIKKTAIGLQTRSMIIIILYIR